jgi:hypothetical protein
MSEVDMTSTEPAPGTLALGVLVQVACTAALSACLACTPPATRNTLGGDPGGGEAAGDTTAGEDTSAARDGEQAQAPAPEPPPPPPPKTGELIQVTVISAEIRGRMANGEHWDGERGKGMMPAPLERYLALHPELAETADTVGIPVDFPDLADRARASPAADPMVIVEIEDAVFRSPMAPRAFNPLWDFSFRFVYGTLGAHKGVPRGSGSMMRIHVVDYDGPAEFDPIGSVVVPMDEILARPVHELGPFGSVDKLTLQVRMLEPPENLDATRVVRLAVASHPSWTDTGIDLVAGQRVVISAADEVCTKRGDDATCTGPQGLRKPHAANLEGFKTVGHGTLVGALGDTRFVVGRSLRFVAPASGRLRLGVNDRDTGNNTGSYAAHVVVHALP